MDREEKDRIMQSQSMLNFLNTVMPLVDHALEQNETMDIFEDNFSTLGDEDLVFGGKSDSTLKEFQSFTDFEFSKGKIISVVDARPDGKGENPRDMSMSTRDQV